MVDGSPPVTDPQLGDLPLAVNAWMRRLRLPVVESNFGVRGVLGLYVLINSAICISLLGVLAWITQEPFVFPSLGPTAFLVFFAALSVQAAPRNVFFGHLIGVIAGVIALLIFGLYGIAPDLESISLARIGACTLCVALTLSIMIWTGTPHAPAGATTLIVGLGLLQTRSQLATLIAAVVLMALLAIVINRLAGLPYPLWSFRPADNPDGAPSKL